MNLVGLWMIFFATGLVWSEAKKVESIGSVSQLFAMRDQLDRMIVMFYAPWCGACTALKPKFENAAADFEDDGDDEVGFFLVDASNDMGLMFQFDITYFPLIVLFRNGKAYEWQQEEANLEKFIAKANVQVKGGKPWIYGMDPFSVLGWWKYRLGALVQYGMDMHASHVMLHGSALLVTCAALGFVSVMWICSSPP